MKTLFRAMKYLRIVTKFVLLLKVKGKSGGGRLITYAKIISERVYLLSIYDKSDQESVTDTFLKQLLKDLE